MVHEVKPSKQLSSAVVEVKPSKQLSSAVVEVKPSRQLSSAVVAVRPSKQFNSAVVEVRPSKQLSSAVVEVNPSRQLSSVTVTLLAPTVSVSHQATTLFAIPSPSTFPELVANISAKSLPADKIPLLVDETLSDSVVK